MIKTIFKCPKLWSDVIWLAGWWEGEGCFTVYEEVHCVMSANSTDLDIIQRVADIIGGKVYPIKPATERHKPKYGVRISGHNCRIWMVILCPLMGQRRQERIKELLSNINSRVLLDAMTEANNAIITCRSNEVEKQA